MTEPEAMPFPVAAEYRIRADLSPLRGPHTVRDGYAREYADEKRALLARAPERHRAVAGQADPDGLRRALERFARAVASERDPASDAPGTPDARNETVGLAPRAASRAHATPARPAQPCPNGDIPVRASGSSLQEVLDFADRLALAIQEDVVIMRVGLGAELLHVCFPSHWDPGGHAGSPLAALHGPVPHGDRLRAASANLLKAMVEKGPFERWVWSINASGALAQHPADPRPAPPGRGPVVDALWFRVERQTTLPLPDLERSVFTIRIFQAPLAEVLRVEPGRAARLAVAIGSMDDALRRYKGLGQVGERLTAELRRYGR